MREARSMREEVTKLLERGQFELGKWASNCPEILKDAEDRPQGKALTKEDGHRVLGMLWEPRSDQFKFQYEQKSRCSRITKRAILSEVASLFDPLGLLGPITIIPKIIMQDIWQSGLKWDESLPEDIHERWIKFKGQLPRLNGLRLPRWTDFGGNAGRVQMHGFCDASAHTARAYTYEGSRQSGSRASSC